MFTPKNPVLLAIQPEFVVDILEGRKTTEYRKWHPSLEFNQIVIYCSKGDDSKIAAGIVAVADVKEIPQKDKDGDYNYKLSNIRAFGKSIPLSEAFPRIKRVPRRLSYLSVDEVQALLDKYPSKVVRKKKQA